MVTAINVNKNYVPEKQFKCNRCASTIGFEFSDIGRLIKNDDGGVSSDLQCPVCGRENRVHIF